MHKLVMNYNDEGFEEMAKKKRAENVFHGMFALASTKVKERKRGREQRHERVK